MGTVGPGSIRLLNGLYDAKKSHAPVLALCGQVPLAELGSDFFQEVDNDALFSDVAVFCQTITSPSQLPGMVEQAVPKNTQARFVARPSKVIPDAETLQTAAERIDAAGKVTLLVGIGAREARDGVLALADRLAAPMVLTLKAKE